MKRYFKNYFDVLNVSLLILNLKSQGFVTKTKINNTFKDEKKLLKMKFKIWTRNKT